MFRIETMSLRGLGSVCAALLAGALAMSAQEVPATPQPQSSAGQKPASSTQATADQRSTSSPTAAEQQPSPDDQLQPTPTPTPKPPSRIKRVLKRAAPNCINLPGNQSCWDKNPRDKEDEADKRERKDEEAQSRLPRNQAPPRSEAPAGQSSSRDTQIDLTPPPDDMTHEGADLTGVTEFHAYDPHKAAKNVEVGDFYFAKKNYRAAESRYEEALQWKPNDAIAMFRLAQAQENLGKQVEAVKNYQAYLKILPEGEFAAESKSGIERLKK